MKKSAIATAKAKRTRPPASSARAAAIALLHLAVASLSLAGAAATAAYPDGVVDNYAINAMGEARAQADRADEDEKRVAFRGLLESRAADAASALERKSSEFRDLRTELDDKLRSVQGARDSVRRELDDLRRRSPGGDDRDPASPSPRSSPDRIRDGMEDVGTKVAELIRRTERALARAGEHNRLALAGRDEVAGEGLGSQLTGALREEIGRRDRHDAAAAEAAAADAAAAELEATEEDGRPVAAPPLPYVARAELEAILSPPDVAASSEASLRRSLRDLTGELMGQHVAAQDEAWNSRLVEVPRRYEEEFVALEGALLRDEGAEERCLTIPAAVEMAGRALRRHHRDGVADGPVADHASYENGGSVAYELTSAAYVPPPRNDGDGGDGSPRAAYEREKRRMFDAQAEDLYRRGREALRGGAQAPFAERLSELVPDPWEWYTSFKFEALRPYLPDDWERLLDGASDRLSGGQGPSWSEYTPRGAVDASIPDHVYHSLGMGDGVRFGRAFGRTAGPEVAISSGRGGGDGGRTPGPTGRCYPLGMRPSDDPAPSLLARTGTSDGDAEASALAGPKYTVRLPYAVRIDAVTLEHRSFPPSPHGSEGGWERGGESAPRWVRVVGFPPCPEATANDGRGGDEDECGARGFDITGPIDLGSFEYKRITVTGREDDYGGGGGDEDDGEGGEQDDSAWPGGRRRSIQTFAVKGGEWKPRPLSGEDDASDGSGPAETKEGNGRGAAASMVLEPDAPAPGQCAPPKDEDSLPSCGDDAVPSSVSREGRHVVEAVSFIIEENWGSSDYTCLYRVRVHGDVVV